MFDIAKHSIDFHAFQVIPASSGRQLIIPDIHGCARTFISLLDRVALTTQDQLFLLGDYIDRGPDSASVIRTILNLRSSGFQVHCLRGNHEQMLLQHNKKGYKDLVQYAKYYGVTNLIDEEERAIYPQFLTFFKSLYYYFELENDYLVHAGFNFEAPDPLVDFEEMLWVRGFVPDEAFAGKKRIIHGHTPVDFQTIEKALVKKKRVLPLDNGCVYAKSNPKLGTLLCLELKSQMVYIERNKEG